MALELIDDEHCLAPANGQRPTQLTLNNGRSSVVAAFFVVATVTTVAEWEGPRLPASAELHRPCRCTHLDIFDIDDVYALAWVIRRHV